MDESVLSSPLEGNLKNLITETFDEWQKAFKTFLEFTDVMKGLEEQRSRALTAYTEPSSSLFPEKLQSWSKMRSSASQHFCQVFAQDFRPKVAKELADLQEEQKDDLKALREAFNACKASGSIILRDSNYLLNYFRSAARSSTTDPWLKELSIRHHSAVYLEHKAEYLSVLFRVYSQVQTLNSELLHKFELFSDEFYALMERFGVAIYDSEAEANFSPELLMIPQNRPPNTGKWQQVLKRFSLDYDWKLECPPLDGFLSTLFTQMKALGAENLSIKAKTEGPSPSLPVIFAESRLRFGFLQNRTSGLLSRSWNVNFVLLQTATSFLHFYKINSSSTSSNSNPNAKIEGNLLVPSIGANDYSKSALNDLNTLALQHFLQSPHQPASISAQILSPFLSIFISKDSKIVASDPETFAFSLKSPNTEKIHLRAFCEEDFVDWVVFLNEAAGKTMSSPRKLELMPNDDHDNEADKIENQSKSNYHQYNTSNTDAQSSSSSSDSSSPTTLTATNSNSSFAPPIVDIENPWN